VSDGRPKLEVVPGGAAADPAEGAPAAEAEADSKGGRLVSWALLVMVVALVVGLVLENRRATGLAAEVGSLENVVGELEAELSATEGALSAHRTHLSEVRAYLSGLSELVERDPEQAP
jgi:hypothetical protein